MEKFFAYLKKPLPYLKLAGFWFVTILLVIVLFVIGTLVGLSAGGYVTVRGMLADAEFQAYLKRNPATPEVVEKQN